ncbi:unnamed protein product, partial [Tenebrio molitor]
KHDQTDQHKIYRQFYHKLHFICVHWQDTLLDSFALLEYKNWKALIRY